MLEVALYERSYSERERSKVFLLKTYQQTTTYRDTNELVIGNMIYEPMTQFFVDIL